MRRRRLLDSYYEQGSDDDDEYPEEADERLRGSYSRAAWEVKKVEHVNEPTIAPRAEDGYDITDNRDKLGALEKQPDSLSSSSRRRAPHAPPGRATETASGAAGPTSSASLRAWRPCPRRSRPLVPMLGTSVRSRHTGRRVRRPAARYAGHRNWRMRLASGQAGPRRSTRLSDTSSDTCPNSLGKRRNTPGSVPGVNRAQPPETSVPRFAPPVSGTREGARVLNGDHGVQIRVRIKPLRSRTRVGDRDRQANVCPGRREDPMVAVHGTCREYLDQKLRIIGGKEPEEASVRHS